MPSKDACVDLSLSRLSEQPLVSEQLEDTEVPVTEYRELPVIVLALLYANFSRSEEVVDKQLEGSIASSWQRRSEEEGGKSTANIGGWWVVRKAT